MKKLKINCYVDFSTERNNTNDHKAGRKYFDSLPVNTYFLCGYQDETDTGKATLYCFDDGTCLIPVFDAITDKQICFPELAGKSISRDFQLITT